MSSYTKLFSSIIHSSVWQLDRHVKILWVTMLAMKDRDGVVEASLPGLAAAAGISQSEAEQALALFTAPDPYSRTETDEGRRVRKVEGGWLVINHHLYNDKSDAADYRMKNAARQARLRARKAAADAAVIALESNATVTPSNATVTPSNGPSRSVTPSTLTLLSSAAAEKEPNQDSAPLALAPVEAPPPKAPRKRKAPSGELSPDEIAAWEAWCDTLDGGKRRPCPAGQLPAIRKALVAYSLDEVRAAFRGVAASEWHTRPENARFRQPASCLSIDGKNAGRIDGHIASAPGAANSTPCANYRDEDRATPESEARYQAGVKANNARIMANLRGERVQT